MKFATYSMHQFNRLDTIPFSPQIYSRFKHGAVGAARAMGIGLAKSFFYDYEPLRFITKQIVIFPSPYYFIPSAAALMTKFFLAEFNRLQVEANRLPAVLSHITRELSYHDDYGKMDATQRAKLIAGDRFFVDHKYLEDKHSIHIDDIRITGSHEREIEKLLGHTSTDFSCIYYAEDMSRNPKTEDYLNNYNLKVPMDIFRILVNEECVFNVRNMRVLLTLDAKTFQDYMSFSSLATKQALYNLAIGNLYHLVDKYKANIEVLKQCS